MAAGLISLAALVCAIRLVMPAHADSVEGFDLAFSLAVIVSLLLSFHILAHDLVLLAVPFAVVVDQIAAPEGMRDPRFAGIVVLNSLFYIYEVYLFLFAWEKVYLLSVALIGFAISISREFAKVNGRGSAEGFS